jgi:ubiquinol-cytochrome c reductase cytochrome c subunit
MSVRREARLLSRILRWGLLAAVGGQVLWSFGPATGQTSTGEPGRELFEASCSTCHGLDASGTPDGPS